MESKAKEFLGSTGFGSGTNYTTNDVAYLMEDYKNSCLLEAIKEIEEVYEKEFRHDEKWATGLRHSIEILKSKIND